MRVGDTVNFHGYHSNGSNVHPAIVTRVWTQDCVNLQVLPDGREPFVATSVRRIGGPSDGVYFSERD